MAHLNADPFWWRQGCIRCRFPLHHLLGIFFFFGGRGSQCLSRKSPLLMLNWFHHSASQREIRRDQQRLQSACTGLSFPWPTGLRSTEAHVMDAWDRVAVGKRGWCGDEHLLSATACDAYFTPPFGLSKHSSTKHEHVIRGWGKGGDGCGLQHDRTYRLSKASIVPNVAGYQTGIIPRNRDSDFVLNICWFGSLLWMNLLCVFKRKNKLVKDGEELAAILEPNKTVASKGVDLCLAVPAKFSEKLMKNGVCTCLAKGLNFKKKKRKEEVPETLGNTKMLRTCYVAEVSGCQCSVGSI